MRHAAPVLLAFACLAAAGPARAEDPIQFFERLLTPPARTLGKALRVPRTTKAAERKAPATAATTTAGPPQPAPPAAEKPAPETVVAQPKEPAPSDLLSVPMPRLRPGDAGGPALGYAPASGIDAAPLAQPVVAPPLKAPPPAALSTCGADIADLGVEAKPLPPIVEGANDACVIPAPVSVSALEGGAVALSPKALVNCSLAEALAAWMKNTVQPIAMETLGHLVTGLRIADAYTCRTRDSLPGAKISEHARGNAIDISAFKLDGIGWIDVEHGWTGGGDTAEFLRQVRASACGPFTTVLGPGSDSYHATHFHLDRAKRRTAGPSHGLYCK